MSDLKQRILEHNRLTTLTPWFDQQLDKHIEAMRYRDNVTVMCSITSQMLADYREDHNKRVAVIGMSGGIDSALTAALFKNASYQVIGVTMPIEQNPEETERGVEVCNKLNIDHINIGLTEQFISMVGAQYEADPFLTGTRPEEKIRRGNIKARLRMITLYNLASRHNGLVASTDNLSELAAGFWTLHGDVGDVAPIQAYTKSWDVPSAALHMGIPENTIKAVPTDGLGISNSDEEQLGVSYLEFDIVLLSLLANKSNDIDKVFTVEDFELMTVEESLKVDTVINRRIRRTQYKRNNPVNLPNPLFLDRLRNLSNKI